MDEKPTYKCDECGKEDDFVEFKKARRTYISCDCGHEWEKGTSHSESTCPNCGNYQHPAAARDFIKKLKHCWYCFYKYGETEKAFLTRKKRNGGTN